MRLKALRAMDEYSFGELALGLLEYIRQGELDRLPPGFFARLHAELGQDDLADKMNALLEHMRETPP